MFLAYADGEIGVSVTPSYSVRQPHPGARRRSRDKHDLPFRAHSSRGSISGLVTMTPMPLLGSQRMISRPRRESSAVKKGVIKFCDDARGSASSSRTTGACPASSIVRAANFGR
jgi:hypothetical protein